MNQLALIADDTTIYLNKAQVNKRELIIKSATIYCHFKNIVCDVNDNVENVLVSGQNVVKFMDGYWSFTDIQQEFKSKGITLIGNYHNGTCSLKSDKDVKLGKLGVLLGFDDSKYVTKDTWYHSGKVNINHGLKYAKISADFVKTSSNLDENGSYTDIITTLPVDTQQSLFSTRTVYNEVNAKVPIVQNFNSINLTLSTNTDWYVEMEALLDIEVW